MIAKLLSILLNPLTIILGIFIGSRLLLAFLIGNCNALAPDEFSYLQLFIQTENPMAAESDLQWIELPRAIRVLIFLPALIFHNLGIDYLMALRLQSIILSFIPILVGFFFMRNLITSSNLGNVREILQTKQVKIYALLIILLPSTIVWTTLGLREPVLYLSIAIIFLGYSRIASQRNTSSSLIWSSVFLSGLIILAIAKLYLFTILAIAIIFSLARTQSIIKKIRLQIFLLTVLAIALQGPVMSQFLNLEIKGVGFSKAAEIDFSNIGNRISVSLKDLQECREENRGGLLIESLNSLLPNNLQAPEVSNGAELTTNQIAATDFRRSDQRNVINLIAIPSGVFTFLFFPLDFSALSLVSIVGAIETILWVPIYWVFIREYALMRKTNRPSIPLVHLALFFIVIFVFFSAATEVNFGTALRHRSVLLMPIVCSTAALYLRRRTK